VGGVVLIWEASSGKSLPHRSGWSASASPIGAGRHAGTLFAVALVSLFVSGFMMSFNGAAYAVLQTTIAPEMQGRVFTLITSPDKGISPVSLAVAGPLAEQFGVRFWYVVGGGDVRADGVYPR